MLRGSVLALGVALCGAAQADDMTPKDFDAACAVVASIELAQITNRDTSDWWTVFSEVSFYFGRLSARDSHAYWRPIIMGRVAERHNQPNPPAAVSACIDLYDKVIAGK